MDNRGQTNSARSPSYSVGASDTWLAALDPRPELGAFDFIIDVSGVLGHSID
ncbi:hypothetical protein I5192_20615 (plasmid) [Ruegeria sp. SCSIO 43209]|jgi:hypothetical protein|uniref:hypothetical protein n=1 Tax=Ruegeria sp. SCSIO 43209 TaxID=2793010 RepID=UPI00147F2C69|nr:hypothetical protein [Ruegeria sp. SCSIO 43209]UAB91235.1 hypothetical protein I5192_20615 [Ruegeria sp. SCSIO 43209]